MRIEVPMLPPRALSPNYCRRFQGSSSRARKALARAVYFCAVDALNRDGQGCPFARARLTYTFVYPVKRKRDRDNLVSSMKAAQDALVQAGILQADDSEHLFYGDHMIEADRQRAPLTIIEINELNKLNNE